MQPRNGRYKELKKSQNATNREEKDYSLRSRRPQLKHVAEPLTRDVPRRHDIDWSNEATRRNRSTPRTPSHNYHHFLVAVEGTTIPSRPGPGRRSAGQTRPHGGEHGRPRREPIICGELLPQEEEAAATRSTRSTQQPTRLPTCPKRGLQEGNGANKAPPPPPKPEFWVFTRV